MIEYTVVRSDRKMLSIEVTKDLKVFVRSPKKLGDKQIARFVADREEWVINALKRQEKKELSRKDYSDTEISELRRMAKEVLPRKVEYYSEIMGVKPTAVKINSAKTRYGSCSGKTALIFRFTLWIKMKERLTML